MLADEALGAPRLPSAPGLNRFIWDFAYPGPWESSPQRSGRNGPLAVPGTYTVRLTTSGAATTQPLTVVIDPRVAADGVTQADLAEQLAHNLRVRDLVSEVNQAVARLQEARRRLTTAEAAQGARADTLRRLAALERRLVTPPVRYSKPELQAHIQYLYGMTTQADQKVGRDAVERYEALRKELDAVLAELRPLLGPAAASDGSRR
jgi:hypothetical protein